MPVVASPVAYRPLVALRPLPPSYAVGAESSASRKCMCQASLCETSSAISAHEKSGERKITFFRSPLSAFCFSFLLSVRQRPEAQRQHDPRPAVEDQLDADEHADDP